MSTKKKQAELSTYDAVKRWVRRLMNDRSFTGKRYFDLFMMVLILFSVGFLLLELQSGKEINKGILSVLDDMVLSIFILEYVSRFWVCGSVRRNFRKARQAHHESRVAELLSGVYLASKDKLKWMIKPMSVIDLLAILPMFRVFRAFRIFRLLRLFKVIRYSHSMESLFMIFKENASEMGIILAFIGLIVVVSSTFIFILEKGGPSHSFDSLGDAVWWSFVTITTVGYGDKVPMTEWGKVLAVFLMLAAIVSIALPSGVLASAMTQKFISIREGKISMKKFRNHIVICGWNNSAEQLMKEIVKHPEWGRWDTVAVTLKPPGEIDSEDVIIKQGDFTKEAVLRDVNADRAKFIVIMAEELRGISDESVDARSFLACNLIHNLNPNTNIIAQFLNVENVNVLKKAVKNVEVIVSDDITGGLLSSSIISPGTSKLVNTLIAHNKDNITKVSVDELEGKFANFRDLIDFSRDPNRGWLPLAVERNGELHINPHDGFEIEAGDFFFCIQTELDIE